MAVVTVLLITIEFNGGINREMCVRRRRRRREETKKKNGPDGCRWRGEERGRGINKGAVKELEVTGDEYDDEGKCCKQTGMV